MLIENKAHVNQADLFGEFPAFVAAQNGHAECLKVLLEAKVDANMRVGGKTLLQVVGRHDHSKASKLKALLLKHGATKPRSLSQMVGSFFGRGKDGESSAANHAKIPAGVGDAENADKLSQGGEIESQLYQLLNKKLVLLKII